MIIYSDKVFDKPLEVIREKSRDRVLAALDRIEALSEKYHLLGYVTYDLSNLYFEVFDSYVRYDKNDINKDFGCIKKTLISKDDYFKAIEKIKNYISNGVTYEVNYTYPFEVFTNLDGIELYESILERQKTPYNMYLDNGEIKLLSYSPELFFKIRGRKILTKPMKGTALREGASKDKEIREFLYNDEKNRSENVMIVDLLRNDLGRIAKTGTVKVDKLFDIEEHPTVFQMTSEISAELEDDISLQDIFKAIFPCGSITGAPKLSTMRVIEELEPYNRSIYCGAIGYLNQDEKIFSVPIRILYGNDYKYRYHVGGAVVWDSTPEDEYEETITKSKILDTDFKLIETAVDDWKNHVNRMKKSAKDLGFIWNDEIEKLKIPKGKILRVLLAKNGQFSAEQKDINPINTNKICIKGQVNSANKFLYHKTTLRDKKTTEYFDEIRVNERGEITEGTFTNIAIVQNDRLYTPPIHCGLLSGTYRKKMIEDGILEEKILYPEDLKIADKIYCFNSVRKMVEVELC